MNSWILRFALAALVLSVFSVSLRNDFVEYDDQLVVTENSVVRQGLTAESVGWAFTTGHFANWMPITWLTHLLDWELYRDNAAGHHATSVLWHLAGTLLLFEALRRMTRAPAASFVVAALYAIHPLHVESVAWIAERKGIVSSAFWMLALLAYSLYVERPTPGRWSVVVIAMGLGLMSKPMLITLPFALLLLDAWPLRRTSGPGAMSAGRLISEKWPLFLMGIAFVPIAYFVQSRGEAISTVEGLPVIYRIINLDHSAIEYLRRVFLPIDLSAFYPHPKDSLSAVRIGIDLSALALLTIASLWAWKRFPWITVGWLWYLVTLGPVSGLIPIGSHGMADRYSDIPLVGIYLALVFTAQRALAVLKVPTWARAAVVATLLVGLSAASFQQVTQWKNTETLFRHVLKVDPDNNMAQNVLGALAYRRGELADAEKLYRSALAADPSFALARTNLALLLKDQQRFQESAEQFREAAEWGEGSAWFDAARMNLLLGKPEDALADCEKGLTQTSPTSADWMLHGYLLLGAGRARDAEKSLLQAIALDPDNAEARRHLGVAYLKQEDYDGARLQFAWASSLNPKIVDEIEAMVNAAGGEDPILLDILAACLSEVDRPGAAAQRCHAAALAADRLGRQDLLPGIEERLGVYVRGQRYLDYHSLQLPSVGTGGR